MRRGRRLMLILAAGLAVVAALLWVALRPVPVTAELATVGRGPMVVTVDVEGKTRIREIYQIAAPIAGTVQRSPVRVGDAVAQGAVVARVEPVAPSLLDARSRSQAQAAVQEAEAALRVAVTQLRQGEADVDYAATQLDRAQELLARGVGTLTRVEDAAQLLAVRRAARDTAASQVRMAEGALARARAALIGPEGEGAGACCIDIHAPAGGLVLSVVDVSARPVPAGAPLLTIGAPDDLEIVAEPLSRDAVRLPPGAQAEVLRWGGEGALTAHLIRLDPSAHTKVSALGIEEQRVEAVFALDGPAPGLGNGYAVFLRVAVWRGAEVVQVPVSALFRQGGDWAVFVVEDGRARLQKLRIGRQNGETAEVLGGLEPGAVVIRHPADDVAEGVGIVEAVRE